jgi:hypothetical protein
MACLGRYNDWFTVRGFVYELVHDGYTPGIRVSYFFFNSACKHSDYHFGRFSIQSFLQIP